MAKFHTTKNELSNNYCCCRYYYCYTHSLDVPSTFVVDDTSMHVLRLFELLPEPYPVAIVARSPIVVLTLASYPRFLSLQLEHLPNGHFGRFKFFYILFGLYKEKGISQVLLLN